MPSVGRPRQLWREEETIGGLQVGNDAFGFERVLDYVCEVVEEGIEFEDRA